MTRVITVILLFIAVSYTSALNILGIFPYQGKSHFIVLRTYLQELVKRGHNVTVISHFPEKNAPKNYHDIDLSGSSKIIEDKIPIERSYLTLFLTPLYIKHFGIENCEVLLRNKEVQDLITKKPKFDVAIVEQFVTDCPLAITYKLNTPVIGVTSHILMPWHYSRFGIPDNPSFVPFHFLEGSTKPTLFQRLERVFFNIYYKAFYYLMVQRANQNNVARYFNDIPPLEYLSREIKLLLLYHNFVLTGSRLFPTNVIEVGGYHVSEAKPLTGELKKFVDKAESGVVYVSFGTLVKSASLSPEKTQAILDTMAQLPQRFIWRWDPKTLTVDKAKIYISDWLPQIDILSHPKTVAFFTHAGMGGTTEALHFGVPMVAMPIVGDQPANAASIEESGLGINIPLKELTKEKLTTAFKTVLDPKFRDNVKNISKAWHDRPLSAMDTAVFWTEFVAKYPDIKYRTAAADVPLYQYWNLDILLVFSVILMLLISLSVAIVKLCCCCGTKKKRKTEIKNKKSKQT